MKQRRYKKQPTFIFSEPKGELATFVEENKKQVSVAGYVVTMVFIILAMSFFASCKSPQPVTQVPIKTLEKAVERLVPVPMPADSTFFYALLECDSMNNVVLKQLKEQKSKGIESDFTFNDGRLDYNAKVKPDTVYIAAKDSIIYKEIPVEVVQTVEVNKLTTWQNIRLWWANISMGSFGLFLVLMLFKWKW